MSKNITLFGQDFSNVPALNVPLQGGGSAKFIDEDDAGGGGGFITAHVTVNTTGIEADSGNAINLHPTLSFSRGSFIYAIAHETDGYHYLGSPVFDEYTTSGTLEYILLTGELWMSIEGGTVTSMSGDITEEDGQYAITGDCTINIAYSE
jgi:hypothetical protein